MRILCEIFLRFHDANLKLKPKKCCFLRLEVPFLGHVTSREGIRPDPTKTEKVRNYVDVTGLCQFFGLALY